jgi:hypothetical protein
METLIFYALLFGLVRFRDGSDKLCANLGKRETETLATVRQAFGERSLGRTRTLQSREHAHHFPSTPRVVLTKNSSWQTKKSIPIPHATVTFCGDCVKMCEDFYQNFGDKRTGCCITTTHRLTLSFPSTGF